MNSKNGNAIPDEVPLNSRPEVDCNVRDDDLSSNCSPERPPNQALHADGARLGETTPHGDSGWPTAWCGRRG